MAATAGASRFPASELALVAVFAALLCALSLAPPVPLGAGVPITLQTLGVMLAGACLGAARGAAAVLTYLVIGFAGLPVFAGGAGGLGVLSRPSAGFLLAFPVGAFVTGLLAQRVARFRGVRAVLALTVAAVIGGVLVVYAGGIVGLMVNARLGLGEALVVAAGFVPGDLAKALITGLVAAAVHRAYPDLLARRRPALR